MKALLAIGAACVALAGCASTTEGSWSCKAPKGLGGNCHSIEENDRLIGGVGAADPAASAIEGAQVVRWWKTPPWSSLNGPGVPAREGDQVMRVVFSPFVDRTGDYYPRSEVYAVMRRGGWWGPAATPQALVDAQPQTSGK